VINHEKTFELCNHPKPAFELCLPSSTGNQKLQAANLPLKFAVF